MTSSQPSRVRRNAATPCRFRTGSISHCSVTDYVFDAESGRLVPRDLTRVYWESATYQAMHGSDDLTKLFKPPEPFPYLVPTGESRLTSLALDSGEGCTPVPSRSDA